VPYALLDSDRSRQSRAAREQFVDEQKLSPLLHSFNLPFTFWTDSPDRIRLTRGTLKHVLGWRYVAGEFVAWHTRLLGIDPPP